MVAKGGVWVCDRDKGVNWSEFNPQEKAKKKNVFNENKIKHHKSLLTLYGPNFFVSSFFGT